MKLSKYTFLFDLDQKEYYAYNTLSNALIQFDDESYSKLHALQNDQGKLSADGFDEELWEALCENLILTKNDEDDYLRYKAIISRIRYQRTSMHMTLAPTMDCCFRCHYCFEKYKGGERMSPKIMDSIIRYVTSFPDLKEIKITWFGGEPLMALPQIEEFYNKFSAVWKNKFVSNIITTGYHISEESVRILQKINVSAVQITLDGMKDTHNKVKNLSNGEDVFERVLKNIELLNDIAPEIRIMIRVNLTLENAHEYKELCQLCYKRFRDRENMGIAPAFVLDRGASNRNDCNVKSTLFNHKNRSEFILDLAKQRYDSPYIRYPDRFIAECAIRNEMSISFDPEGYAYKCWEVIGNKEYAIGKLDADGNLIDIKEKVLNRQLFGADPLDDPICMKCKYLPLCNGGCPIQRIENKFEGGHNCTCTYYKGYMADFLKVHLARKKAMERMSNQDKQ